jgi:hypothetical protein
MATNKVTPDYTIGGLLLLKPETPTAPWLVGISRELECGGEFVYNTSIQDRVCFDIMRYIITKTSLYMYKSSFEQLANLAFCTETLHSPSFDSRGIVRLFGGAGSGH